MNRPAACRPSPTNTAVIRVTGLSIRQDRFALNDISFEVPKSCYAVLMGRTGCGKTTIIEAICGLRKVAHGSIKLHNNVVTHWPPAARNVGYVPQDAALFDTMRVRDHLAFALQIRKVDRATITKRVAAMAELLGLEELLDRSTHRLSGGEKQRVSLGRALAFQPRTLLLDEPLSALDDETRNQMYDVLRRVKEYTQVTALHVTHNEAEAESVGDALFRLADGKVQQV